MKKGDKCYLVSDRFPGWYYANVTITRKLTKASRYTFVIMVSTIYGGVYYFKVDEKELELA